MNIDAAYNLGWDNSCYGEIYKNPYNKETQLEEWQAYNEGYHDEERTNNRYDFAG